MCSNQSVTSWRQVEARPTSWVVDQLSGRTCRSHLQKFSEDATVLVAPVRMTRADSDGRGGLCHMVTTCSPMWTKELIKNQRRTKEAVNPGLTQGIEWTALRTTSTLVFTLITNTDPSTRRARITSASWGASAPEDLLCCSQPLPWSVTLWDKNEGQPKVHRC